MTLKASLTMPREHSDIKSRPQIICCVSVKCTRMPRATVHHFHIAAGGIITPDMTQKEIREVVKELNGKKTIEGEAKELATEKVEKKKAEPEKALEGLTDDGIKAYREFRRQIDKEMGEKWYNVVTLTFIKEDGTKDEKLLKVTDWYGKSIETEIIEKMEKEGK